MKEKVDELIGEFNTFIKNNHSGTGPYDGYINSEWEKFHNVILKNPDDYLSQVKHVEQLPPYLSKN